MNDEKVFTIVSLKEALEVVPRESILSSKWVFVKKTKPEQYKARLVARGFRQIQGINFEETFAPTLNFNALQLLFLTAALMKWEIRTFGVKVAFLHSFIDKLVYMWPPQGFSVPKHHLIKLEKALYGTKQVARCWWMHLKQILLKIGFIANKENPSTYSFESKEGKALLWIHVDNGAITASSNKLMTYLISQLDEQLKIKWDKEINKIVGLTIEKGTKGYKFHQQKLVEKLTLLNPSNITALSPSPHNCQLESHKAAQVDKEYLKPIGILLYIAQGSQPNIAYTVNYLARFSMCATTTHWNALEHLIAYLRRTKDLGILILTNNTKNKLTCYVDANWGGEGNHSTHGYLLLHGKNPIAWQSKQQIIVASSTAQAEYIALSFAAKECLWISHLFASTTGHLIPYMLSDNKTAIRIANDSLSRKQTRHLIREFNLINEYIVRGKIHLDWISTNFQLADIMTKSIGSIKTKQFTNVIKLCFVAHQCSTVPHFGLHLTILIGYFEILTKMLSMTLWHCFVAVSFLFSPWHAAQASKSVDCDLEFNTRDFAPNFTADVPVNCIDFWRTEYTCASSSCKNYNREDRDLSFGDCWEYPGYRSVSVGSVRSYKIHFGCNRIELSQAPYPSTVVKSSWWCKIDRNKHFNTNVMTCDNCIYNRTGGRISENCKSLP
ncbi:hypothetical protein O181_051672 [Austropuccinia psidii MF-1]|uniref:Reverse transcriptase Ty1/copia-type domain-containing protein n=1 Tax=Austropuccinia psidii MF-1 TaxID=1389203 RepID=A0A9Q3E1E0_9BASI|nr:hypothetical protein [Austropuccinia psidii MF-1]